MFVTITLNTLVIISVFYLGLGVGYWHARQRMTRSHQPIVITIDAKEISTSILHEMAEASKESNHGNLA